MGAGFNDRLAVQDVGLMPFVSPTNGKLYRVVSGTWNTSALSSAILGTYVYQTGTTTGVGIEIDFRGQVFGLVALKSSSSGIVDLYIDGTVAVSGIDLYAASDMNSQLVALLTNLTPGQHTAKIVMIGKNASSSGYSVYLEAALVESTNVCITGLAQSLVSINTVVNTQASTNYNATGFWNAAAVAAGGVSTSVSMGGARVRVLVNVSAATDITVQHSANNSVWYDGETISFTAAGTKTIVVDCSLFVRLKSSAAATITAGYIYLRG
jgi:hypothetical protein